MAIQPMWIPHPIVGSYYNWHPQWNRWPNTTITCDPFGQSILAWGASKEITPGTIEQHYETSGGWEVWAQSELHVYFANDPSRSPYDSIWREPHIYANAPSDKADFLLHFQPTLAHAEPVSVFIELKCELFGEADTIYGWARKVGVDIAKINSAVVNKDHANTNGPYHGYAIALTRTQVADSYMRGLGMTMEPSFTGRNAGFNLWWYHRVCA